MLLVAGNRARVCFPSAKDDDNVNEVSAVNIGDTVVLEVCACRWIWRRWNCSLWEESRVERACVGQGLELGIEIFGVFACTVRNLSKVGEICRGDCGFCNSYSTENLLD